ncbi:MAG TPA: S53 family peptidase [Gemmataceae bacterium]|nr:S53 family peptidase [Gemmataceae bacterium]
MMTQSRMVPLAGSQRPAVPGARLLQKSDPNQQIKVSIYARRNPNRLAAALPSMEALNAELPGQRRYFTNQQFNLAYGADPADLEKIAAWARSKNLRVLESSVPKRRVLVEGTIQNISEAFGVQLNDFEQPQAGRYRGREGQIYLPSEVHDLIEGVFGLDTRPVGRSRLRRSGAAPARLDGLKPAGESTARVNVANPWPGTFFPPEVAQLYDYPADLDGGGENVAVFAFNGAPEGDPHGGYSLPALKSYFERVLGGPTPSITDVVVQGPGNNPGPDTPQSGQQGDATGEVMLDMCVVGSVAPGAKIFMYFTIFTSQGWVDALHEAITDANNISVISISYGNPEDDPRGAWTKMGVKVVNTALEAAAAKGITICVASGDDGSTDQDTDDRAHVDFPASSPNVLGVGGTRLKSAGDGNPTIADEAVWNDLLQDEGAGGGGVSALFTLPAYQNKAGVPPSVNPPHRIGRGVPDVAAVADPETGVVIMHVDGKHLEPIGGTSAAAPLWAALIARLNQGLKARCGFLNTILYTKCANGVLNDITEGNNGAYPAGAGWDACTGLGSPDGGRLLKALAGKTTTRTKKAATAKRGAKK